MTQLHESDTCDRCGRGESPWTEMHEAFWSDEYGYVCGDCLVSGETAYEPDGGESSLPDVEYGDTIEYRIPGMDGTVYRMEVIGDYYDPYSGERTIEAMTENYEQVTFAYAQFDNPDLRVTVTGGSE